MSRRQRQVDELRALCQHGAVGRAIDLAFEHFAQFGPDREVLDLLAATIARCCVHDRVHQRFIELRAPSD